MKSAVPELLTDADVCRMLRCSRYSIIRRLRPSYKPKDGEYDLRLAKPGKVGKIRYWLADDLAKVLRREV